MQLLLPVLDLGVIHQVPIILEHEVGLPGVEVAGIIVAEVTAAVVEGMARGMAPGVKSEAEVVHTVDDLILIPHQSMIRYLNYMCYSSAYIHNNYMPV